MSFHVFILGILLKKIKKLSRGEKERCDYKKWFKNSSLKNKHPFIY